MAGGTAMDRMIEIASCDAPRIPDEARRMARFSLFDWLSVARAGIGEPVSRIVRELVAEEGGKPVATVAGLSAKLPARAAALANGTTSHALDYDDTHFAHVGHLAVGIMPAALAVAEESNAVAADCCDAFLLGAEAAVRLGMVLGRGHYEHGFHQTATSGAFGATVAAGRLYGLNYQQMRHALSLVSTRASGLKSQFGTMGKPFNAGIAAANGIEAAALARRGLVSCIDGIGGAQGFIATHSETPAGEAVWDAMPPGHFLFDDIKYKFHACCHGTHAMIEALRELQARHKLPVDSVSRIAIRVNPRWLKVCDIKAPQSGLEIKFSYGFLAAMVLAGFDTASDAAFADQLCADERLMTTAARVEVGGDARLSDTAAAVTIRTSGGETVQAVHDIGTRLAPEVIERGLRRKSDALLGGAASEALWSAVTATGKLRARDLAQLLNA